MTTATRTTATFRRPFELAGFDETLPAGDYEIEPVPSGPRDAAEPADSTSSVRVHLHPRASHPGLSRTLTVPLSDLHLAAAKDRLGGRARRDHFLEEKLADPMIRLFMRADAVTEADVRSLYPARAQKRVGGHAAAGRAGRLRARTGPAQRGPAQRGPAQSDPDLTGPDLIGPAVLAYVAVPPRLGSSRPGIGE